MLQSLLRTSVAVTALWLLVGCRPLSQLDITELLSAATATPWLPTPASAPAGQAPAATEPLGTPAAAVTVEAPAPAAVTATPTAPALPAGSFCHQTIGDPRLQFSATLTDVLYRPSADGDELIMRFDPAEASALPAAAVACLQPGRIGEPAAYALQIDFAGWQRDARFAASAITATLSFGTGPQPQQVQFFADAAALSGLQLVLPLAAPRAFSVERSADGRELRVRLAAAAPLRDPLATAGGALDAGLPPFVLVSAGDVWLVDAARPGEALNLTNSPEIETAAALSPDGQTVYFCRADAGYEPRVAGLPVPASLFRLALDGGELQQIAQIGGDCAQPTVSRDNQQVAFVVRETADEPPLTAVYLVAADGSSAATRIGEPVDAWSRSHPQWLANGALVYNADGGDGRAAVRIRQADGSEIDIGDSLLVSPALSAMYRAPAAVAVAPDGLRLAIELRRSADEGADLLIVGADGTPLDLIGAEGFWSAPLGWDADGRLYLLQTGCVAGAVQPYRLQRWDGAQQVSPISDGSADRQFGPAAINGSTLLIVRNGMAPGTVRGPLVAADGADAMQLWAYDLRSGAARQLLDLPDGALIAWR